MAYSFTHTKADYTFTGWSKNKDAAMPEYPEDEVPVTGNMTLYAVWTKSVKTYYTVAHLKQMLKDSDTYFLQEEEPINDVWSGQWTAATPKTYSNYTVGDIEKKIILASGNTTVNIYYNKISEDGANGIDMGMDDMTGKIDLSAEYDATGKTIVLTGERVNQILARCAANNKTKLTAAEFSIYAVCGQLLPFSYKKTVSGEETNATVALPAITPNIGEKTISFPVANALKDENGAPVKYGAVRIVSKPISGYTDGSEHSIICYVVQP